MNTEEKSLAKEPDLITLVDGFIAINKQRDVDMAKTQLSEYLKEHEISPDAFEYVPDYFDAALYGKHYNHERYVNLLKICKVAYQYEQNGIPEEHAFKLSIIFSSEKDAYAYLRFYASQTFHLKKQDMKAIEAEALKTAQQRAGGDAKKQSELQELISNERKKEALRSLKKQQVTLHNACLFGLPEPQCNMDFWKKHAKEGLKDATFRSILSFAGDIEQLWQENRPKNQTMPDRQEVEKINQAIAKLKKRPGDTRAERIRLLSERYAKTSKYDVELIKLKTEQVEAVNREYKARKRNQDTRHLSPAEKEAATKELGELAGILSHLRCELFDISAGRSLKDISMAQIIAAAEKRSSIKQGGVKDYLRKNGLSDNQIQQFLMLDRKDNDTNIPPIHIDGKSIGYDGLYLMKVPVLDDMHAARATVFGRLTHCCQSLGDVGADCVKHGVASEHGGFYVVCKGDVNHPGVEDKVLGQSWVWRSRSGAMVFDSVETNSENNKAVKQFFNQLAMALVKKGHADKIVCGAHSGISSRMGITPLRSIKEYPVDYTKYRDSHNQRIIFDKKVPFYFYDTIEEAKKETKSFIEKALSSDTPLNNNLSFCVLLNLIKVEGNPHLQTLVEKKVNESQRKTE